MGVRNRFLNALRRSALEADFDDEIQDHLERRIAEYRGTGMSDADARRLAHVRFGSIAAAKGGMRAARTLGGAAAVGLPALAVITVATILGGLWIRQPVYDIGGAVQAPIPIVTRKPNYTPAAVAAKIQGVVRLRCILSTDGVCADVAVERSLDTRTGLDQEALDAMRSWRFKPGTRDGVPVKTRIHVDMTFALR